MQPDSPGSSGQHGPPPREVPAPPQTVGWWRDLLCSSPPRGVGVLLDTARRLTRALVPNENQAEDVAHEVVLRVLDKGGRAADRAAADAPLEAWLRGIVRNILFEYHREQQRWECYCQRRLGEVGPGLPVAGAAPDQHLL